MGRCITMRFTKIGEAFGNWKLQRELDAVPLAHSPSLHGVALTGHGNSGAVSLSHLLVVSHLRMVPQVGVC